MKRNSIKKLLAVFLVAVMTLGCLCVPAFAANCDANKDNTDRRIVYFGSYPQSEVTDKDLVDELNALEVQWNSYGYYRGEDVEITDASGKTETVSRPVAGDWMAYADTVLDGVKYRAVKISDNRPFYTDYNSAGSYQDDNGYKAGNVYWFRYEPLKWLVLNEKDGERTVYCESLIDSQPYCNTVYEHGNDVYGKTGYWGDENYEDYANDYSASSVRAWLNSDFYNTAFSEEEKEAIAVTTVNNDAFSASNSDYGCMETEDKIFLLSYQEMTNTRNGFFADGDSYYGARGAEGTDYAKCQGLRVFDVKIDEENTYEGSSWWWLRSAGNASNSVSAVQCGGYINSYGAYVNYTYLGIRPALTLKLTPEIYNHENVTCTRTKEPTCTENGIDKYECQSCGYSYEEILPALGHSYSITESKAPTCIADGFEKYRCSVCGNSYKTILPATGHDLEVIDEQPATCSEKGYRNSKCKNCDYTLEEELAATGHRAYEDDRYPASCTQGGIVLYKCEFCDFSYTELFPAYGHTPVIDGAVAPTCSKTGLTQGSHCFTCGEVLVKRETIPATNDHKDENDDGYCDSCNKVLDETKTCDCICHKDGFAGFIYKIVRAFWKLFNLNQTCECGAQHY
ncbi:MAG: DUF6273 domain-containing protein [Acutalibacteraceae bacterium]